MCVCVCVCVEVIACSHVIYNIFSCYIVQAFPDVPWIFIFRKPGI